MNFPHGKFSIHLLTAVYLKQLHSTKSKTSDFLHCLEMVSGSFELHRRDLILSVQEFLDGSS